MEILFVLSEVWYLLPAFCRYSVRRVPCVDVFFDVFVGGGELYILPSGSLYFEWGRNGDLEIFFLNWLLYEKPFLPQVWEFILFHFLSLSLRLELWTSGSQQNFKMKTALLHRVWRMFVYVLLYYVSTSRVEASQVVLAVKNPPANAGSIRNMGSVSRSGGFPWRREWQPTPVFLLRGALQATVHGETRVLHDWSDLCMCCYVSTSRVTFLQPHSVS